MRRPALSLVVAATAVLLAACPNDDDDDTASTAPASTGPASTSPPADDCGFTPVTTQDTTTPEPSEEASWWYRSDVVIAFCAGAIEQVPEGLEPIEGGGEGLLAFLREATPDVSDDGSDVDARSLDALLQRGLRPFQVVDEGIDPLEAASQLEQLNAGAIASPVLLLTLTGHVIYAPGAAPEPLDDLAEAPAVVGSEFESTDSAIAVIDTGYTSDPNTPDTWLADRVQAAVAGRDDDVLDPSSDLAGHGKFVASVIAQRDPNDRIVVAGLTQLDRAFIFQGGGESDRPGIWTDHELPAPDVGFLADEFELYLAVGRLLAVEGVEYKALNVSLGAYEPYLPDAPFSRAGLLIRDAMVLWRDSTGAPIVAAAGNHRPDEPEPTESFLPADLPDVLDVESVDVNDNLSAFSNTGEYRARGENVVGIRFDGEWTSWSGTSFAAPIVTGMIATGGVATPGATADDTGVLHL